MGRIANLSDDMAEMVTASGRHRDRLAASVAALLNERLNENAGHSPLDRLTSQVLQTTRSAFIQKMEMASMAAGFELTVSA